MDQVSENPVKNRHDSFNSLVVISGMLITLYLTANIMAVKLISVFGVTLFDAGTVTFPLAYMLGDVLTEVWGFRTARRVIVLTFACNVLLVISTAIGLVLPAADYMEKTTQAYSVIFTYVPRIVAASLIAFLGGQILNSWTLVKIGEWTHGKHLWMRTIGSSAAGYVFDTVAFVLIAFAGIAPTKDLLTMIIAQYCMKLGLESFAATPLAYALIGWMKRRRAIEEA